MFRIRTDPWLNVSIMATFHPPEAYLIATLVGVTGGTFLAAVFTDAKKARAFLGSHARDYSDEELTSAMRGSIWSLDGLLLVVLVVLYLRAAFYVASLVASLFGNRMWVGAAVAAALGAMIPTIMRAWRKRTMLGRLESR